MTDPNQTLVPPAPRRRRTPRALATLGATLVIIALGAATATASPTTVPPPPGPAGHGDNYAVAVNHANYATVARHSFSLNLDFGSPVTNTNEAYAYSSCTGCTTRAVAFQVVLIFNNPSVIAPRNISQGYNVNCVSCTTSALAEQLDLSVNGPVTSTEAHDVAAIWQQAEQYGDLMNGQTDAQILAQLHSYEQQIYDVITKDSGTAPVVITPSSS